MFGLSKILGLGAFDAVGVNEVEVARGRLGAVQAAPRA
jgi:hypothetical protein